MTTPTAVTGLPRPRVVLVGPPGAGKSTIGRRLSHALSCELVDSDHLIEQAKNKPCGCLLYTSDAADDSTEV